MREDSKKLGGALCTLSLSNATLAAAVLYQKEAAESSVGFFQHRFRALAPIFSNLSRNCDVVAIDQCLERAADQWHPSIVAVAMSVYVPGASGPTGGILGFPGHPWTPAGKYMEKGPHGLSLSGMPGGPGVLVAGDFTHAKGLFSRCALPDGRLLAATKIVDAIQREGISTALWVTDGCGASAVGRVGLYEQGRVEEINLRQLHEQSDQKNRRQPN
uniref:hypothetical protein n=1 Tax=Ndongobacter massiliensis TaxID=1871025 RepID=UPI000930201A|nr:hypothetical protein [Ndongobacter massiliensis]